MGCQIRCDIIPSYLIPHWSDFSGFCIISWILNLKPDCGLLRRAPPLYLAWIPCSGFRSLSPTTGSGQNLQDFEDSLMAFLGKETESAAIEYSLFRSSLWKFQPREWLQQHQQWSAEPVFFFLLWVDGKSCSKTNLELLIGKWQRRREIHRHALIHTDKFVLAFKLWFCLPKLQKLVIRGMGFGVFGSLTWHKKLDI